MIECEVEIRRGVNQVVEKAAHLARERRRLFNCLQDADATNIGRQCDRLTLRDPRVKDRIQDASGTGRVCAFSWSRREKRESDDWSCPLFFCLELFNDFEYPADHILPLFLFLNRENGRRQGVLIEGAFMTDIDLLQQLYQRPVRKREVAG
jgi:hypothetical protein